MVTIILIFFISSVIENERKYVSNYNTFMSCNVPMTQSNHRSPPQLINNSYTKLKMRLLMKEIQQYSLLLFNLNVVSRIHHFVYHPKTSLYTKTLYYNQISVITVITITIVQQVQFFSFGHGPNFCIGPETAGHQSISQRTVSITNNSFLSY